MLEPLAFEGPGDLCKRLGIDLHTEFIGVPCSRTMTPKAFKPIVQPPSEREAVLLVNRKEHHDVREGSSNAGKDDIPLSGDQPAIDRNRSPGGRVFRCP